MRTYSKAFKRSKSSSFKLFVPWSCMWNVPTWANVVWNCRTTLTLTIQNLPNAWEGEREQSPEPTDLCSNRETFKTENFRKGNVQGKWLIQVAETQSLLCLILFVLPWHSCQKHTERQIKRHNIYCVVMVSKLTNKSYYSIS